MKKFYLLSLVSLGCLFGSLQAAEEHVYTQKLVSVTESNGQTISYDYDKYGNMTLTEENNRKSVFIYDEEGRVTSQTILEKFWGEWFVMSDEEYEYDSNGRTLFEKHIRYDYDGRIVSHTETEHSFDKDGNMLLDRQSSYDAQGMQIGGTQTEYLFDDSGNLQKLTNQIWDSTARRWADLSYEVYENDENGNPATSETFELQDGEWMPVMKYVRTFDEYGCTQELGYAYQRQDWRPYTKVETIFYGRSDSYRISRYLWNLFDDQWTYSSGDDHIYEGDILVMRHYDAEGSEDRGAHSEIGYDAEGRVTYRKSCTSHGCSTHRYEYDNYGSLVYYSYDDSMDISYEEKYEYEYDKLGAPMQMLTSQSSSDTGNEWVYLSTTVWEYDKNVSATDVAGCPSPYYMLLAKKTSSSSGNTVSTTYTYDIIKEINAIKSIRKDSESSPVYYDLWGRRVSSPRGFVVKGE